MKKIIFCLLLSVVWLSTSYAQYRTERTGYEGDYFSLEGALDLFKRSSSLRDFERRINTEENWVNNLDLDYDGRIDYIRVEHRRQGDFHAIILQALVGRYDIQDVAVIEIEMIGRDEAILQIVGDEDLYGEAVFVEPVEGYADSRRGYHSDYGDYVNVYYWRPVQYILGRQYRVYASPYRWNYYPTWWSPWVQCSWSVFRPRIVIYLRYYQVVPRHRVIRVHNFYRPYRSYCNTVVQHANRVRIKHGRSPIHRPSPVVERDRRSGDYHRRNSVAERRRATDRTGAPGQDPSLSRKRTPSSFEQNDKRTGPARTDQRSRNAVDSPGTSRQGIPSRESRSPSFSRKSTPAYEQKQDRSRNPQIYRPRDKNPSRSTGRMPSADKDRSTGQPKSDRGASSRDYQQSRDRMDRSDAPTRSRTITRSTTPIRKPSVNGRRTAPPKKSESTRSSTPKRDNSNGGSRSRSRRGGN